MAIRFGTKEAGVEYRLRPAAYVVILDPARRVACVSERSGLFLPGGGIESGEDDLAAIHREVAEECARELHVARRLEPATQFFRSSDGGAYELRASFFVGEFGAALDRTAEHELSWAACSPEPPRFFHECHRWAVEQAARSSA